MINNKSLTFIYGSDDFLVDRRAKFIFSSIANGNGEIYDLSEPSSLLNVIRNATSSIATVAMFQDSEVIWLRSACFFSDINLSAEKKDAVEQLIEIICQEQGKRIILSASPVDKRTKIFKKICTAANAIEIDSEQGSQNTVSVIKHFVEEMGISIETDAADLLASKCGNNYRTLEQEIDKLATYVSNPKQPITINDVAELVDDTSEGNFFDTVEKFFARDANGMLDALRKYFFHNNDIRPLLAAFNARIRSLIQLQSLLNGKKIKVIYNNIVKSDFYAAAKFFYMDQGEKSSFNVFSQNIWYLSKIISNSIGFGISQLINLQICLTNAMPELSAGSANEQFHLISKILLSTLANSIETHSSYKY